MTANQSAATAETLGTTAADWWNTPETMHTPISQLVAGLDDLPELPIPYGRLPRRAYNVYSNDFTHWSDIAGQTLMPSAGLRPVHRSGVRFDRARSIEDAISFGSRPWGSQEFEVGACPHPW